jgi:hypothetical protein
MTTMTTPLALLFLTAVSAAPRAAMQETPIRAEAPSAGSLSVPSEGKLLAEVEMAAGESRTLPDLGLSLKLISVQESGERCLGGPLGCPVRVRLQVKKGDETETVRVVGRAGLASSARRGAEAFGYRIGVSRRSDRGVRVSVWTKEAVRHE